jgi:hypothetical protein
MRKKTIIKDKEVKIIQIIGNPSSYYKSNGSLYKNKVEYLTVYGLGDDGNVYTWGNWSTGKDLETELNWRLDN